MSNKDELNDVQEILAEVDVAIAELQTLSATQETTQILAGKIERDWLPKPYERVVVRSEGFTCLAYRDSIGIWRADKHDDILPDVSEIVFRF